MSAPSASADEIQESSRLRRIAEGTGAVAIWICLGLLFHTSANAYLLLGVPITLVFQRYVRRAPLRSMWVTGVPHEAPPFRLGGKYLAMALALTVTPLAGLANSVRAHESPVDVIWMLAAMAGAWAAAYALCCASRETFRALAFCLLTAGALGCAIMIAGATTIFGSPRLTWPALQTGLKSFLEYLPVLFVLEEVWFRGVLDSHLHHPGEPRGLASAVYVSALWGAWHYPIAPEPRQLDSLLLTVLPLLAVHICIGTPLCWWWRRSGNLLVPGAVHALIDAVRNAVMTLP